MKKKISLILIWGLIGNLCIAQNINQNVNQNVNQNTIIINNQPAVVEKEVVIEKEVPVPVYIKPKRYARKLPAPICLQNYLWVYPEDLGEYVGEPRDMILQINNQRLYGRNTWRVPTDNEVQLMQNFADECGLGDGRYWSTYNRRGILRLVSTGPAIHDPEAERWARYEESRRREEQRKIAILKEKKEQQVSAISSGKAIPIGSTLWMSSNMGTTDPYSKGVAYREINCPDNWRLPTEDEFKSLIQQSTKLSTYYKHSSGLVIPFGVYAIKRGDNSTGFIMLPNMIVSNGFGLKFARLVQDKIY